MCYLLPLCSFADNPQIIVGDYYTIKNKPMPLLAISQTENNWTYPTLPELTNDRLGVDFSSASCNSKFCAAVGTTNLDQNPKYNPLIAVSFDHGNQWSYISKLGEKDNFPGQTSSVSCTNNLCVAVGTDIQKGYHPYMPLLTVGHGNEWNIPSSVINNLPSDFIEGDFGYVTCNKSFCIAAGEYDSKDGHSYPLVAVSYDKDKVHWTYSSSIAATLPKDVELTDVFGLNCTDKVCIISGLYRLPSDKQIAFLATSYDKGKTWTFPTDISSKLPDSDDSRLDKVNCYKDLCVAVGSYYSNQDRKVLNYIPLIAVSHDSGKTWSYVNDLGNKLPLGYDNGEFWNIGCNEKLCLAGGQLSVNNHYGPFLMYSKDQGNTWSMLNELPKDYVDGGDFTGGVNCSDTTCFAVGNYRNTSQRFVPLLVSTQDGNTWSYPSSVIDNLPQDFMYTNFLHTDSYSNGLMAHKKHKV